MSYFLVYDDVSMYMLTLRGSQTNGLLKGLLEGMTPACYGVYTSVGSHCHKSLQTLIQSANILNYNYRLCLPPVRQMPPDTRVPTHHRLLRLAQSLC